MNANLTTIMHENSILKINVENILQAKLHCAVHQQLRDNHSCQINKVANIDTVVDRKSDDLRDLKLE